MISPSVTRTPNILVAEDDANDFFYLQDLLGSWGIASIFHVQDGAQAIAYLRREGPFEDRSVYPFPDMLLLDLNLPKVSGHEVLEWLQGQKNFRRPTTYVLSGSNFAADHLRARRTGAEACFVKPLSLGHVAMLIENFQTAGAEPSATGTFR
jgi:CheY-like chemotaxis protein